MMLVPVLERFAEFGWQLFVEPAETYEFFTVSGVFKRAHIDAKLHVVQQQGAQHLVQRNALFDVCLASGLAHIIVAYIRAEAPRGGGAFANGSPSTPLTGLEPKNYVLKEPIAVQQWARRRLESVERRVNEIVADDQFHGGHADSKEPSQSELEASIRELNGLRSIAMTLVERLKEGSRHVTQLAQGNSSMRLANGVASSSSSSGDKHSSSLEETELSGLTRAGIQNLLELLGRIQTVVSACQCMLWLEENHISVDERKYEEFYKSAKATRATYWDQFVDNYGGAVSSTSTGGELSEPLLLIENVMRSANVTLSDLGGGCPPRQLNQLLQLLRAQSIQDDVINYYGDEMEREPIEGFFRVQVALLMYFCLDRAYLSDLSPQVHTGVRIAHKMRAMADSFAAQLNVRDDMKLTLLALWLIENAATVNTGNHDHVTAIYDSAIGLLQQSSAMHLHQKYDLEPDLILHVIETLVHRGESVVAWKVWNTFGVDLANSPSTATELAVVVSLELDLWERALTILRAQKRVDLLELVINWLVKSNRVKELVQSATLLAEEEMIFHQLMLNAGIFSAEDALKDENIRRADLLTMYYALRTKYETAWAVHHEHLAMIRSCTSGDTQIAAAVLNQLSFRARAALLENLCPEPTQLPPSSKFVRKESNNDDDMAIDADINPRHKQPMLLQSASGDVASTTLENDSSEMMDTTLPGSSFNSNRSSVAATPLKSSGASGATAPEYSPGIYSSRASLPRSSSAKKRPAHSGEAGVASTGKAINSAPDSPSLRLLSRRHSSGEDGARKVVQSLNFGSTPVTDFGKAFSFGSANNQSSDATFTGKKRLWLSGSVAVQTNVSVVLRTARQPANQPLRSRFNNSFHSSSMSSVQNPGGVSTDGTVCDDCRIMDHRFTLTNEPCVFDACAPMQT